MNNIEYARKGREEKTLNMLVRYKEGVMSRREWLELQKSNGSTVRQSEKPRNKYSRTKFNRMTDIRAQEEYERKCFEEKVVCYQLVYPIPNEGCLKTFVEITKIEFDYFNSL